MTLEVVSGAPERGRAERAHLLRRAQHPGVAALVEHDDVLGTAVTLAPHEGPRLGDTTLTVDEIAGVFAVLATTVADLNDLGVQIGVVTGDGVRLGRDGRPVIVDLDGATLAEPPPRRGRTPQPDGRALGALLMETLRRCAPELITGSQAVRWPHRRAQTLGQRVAALATNAERGTIPVRQLADALVHPDARLPRPTATPGPAVASGPARTGRVGIEPPEGNPAVSPLGTAPRHRVGRLLEVRRRMVTRLDLGRLDLGRLDLGRLDLGRLDLGRLDFRRRELRRLQLRGLDLQRLVPRRPGAGPWVRRGAIGIMAVAGGTLVALGVAAIPAPARPHTRLGPAAPAMPTGAFVCLAVSASGSCTSAATYAGGVLTTPIGRFAVGRPGDVVTAGRWSCGPATLAILRPDRGEVWAFPSWPAGGSILTARLVARVAQARQLTVQAEGGCDALVVSRADGTTVVVDRRMFP